MCLVRHLHLGNDTNVIYFYDFVTFIEVFTSTTICNDNVMVVPAVLCDLDGIDLVLYPANDDNKVMVRKALFGYLPISI